MAKDSLEMEGREGSWRGYISPGLLAADMSQLLREAWVRCRNLGVDPAGVAAGGFCPSRNLPLTWPKTGSSSRQQLPFFKNPPT